jgi:hypothetical protein
VKMNFKDWKKVSDEKDVAVFKNRHGHELRVGKAPLSPKMRAELEALPIHMADGGEVKPKASKPDLNNPEHVKQIVNHVKKAIGMADGGEVDAKANFDETPGGPVFSDAKFQENSSRMPDPLDISIPEPATSTPIADPGVPTTMAPVQPEAAPQAAPSAAPAPQPAAQVAPSTAQASPGLAPQPAGPPDIMGSNAALAQYDKGVKMQEAGIQREANALSSQSKQEAETLQKQQEYQQNAISQFQADNAKIHASITKAQDAYAAGKVDPKRFWSNLSTGDKILSTIGLILGGIGGGINKTGGNVALDILNRHISNDIDAQKADMTKNENLVGMAYKQFGNLKDASEYAMAMQMGLASTKLKEAAAKSGDPIAQARALKASGELEEKKATLVGQVARNQTVSRLMTAAQGSPDQVPQLLQVLRQTDPEKAKEIESRYVPGVGLGSVPVPEAVRTQIVAQKNFDTAVKDLQHWTKTHTTVLPGTADYNVGEQKALELQTVIREGLLNTVYKAGEQPLLDKMIKSNPANLLKNFNTLPQLKELMRSNDAKSAALRSTYGLPVGASGSQQESQRHQAYLDFAKQNPNDPRSKKILEHFKQQGK